jgi:zinc protease
MLTRGTAKRTRDELVTLTEGMAGSVAGLSARNSIGVSGKFLSKDFDLALDIVSDVILNPAFPEDELKKLRDDRLAAIKREEDELSGYTFKLLRKAMFKTHPYGLSPSGEIDTVSAFDRKVVGEFHKKTFAPERMVMAVVGDFDSRAAAEKIKAAFKGFKRSGETLKPPAQEARQNEPRKTGDSKDKAQTHIAIAFQGTRVTDEDNLALEVLSQILAGQGGRLFIELRDKQSLAYVVDAYSVPGVDPGLFGVYIGTSPDKKEAAITGMLAELKKVLAEPVTDDELSRAKSAMIGGYEIGLQDPGAKAADMATNELIGLGLDHYRKYAKKLGGVTKDDVLKAARKYIRLDAYTMAIVGPGEGVKAEPAK